MDMIPQFQTLPIDIVDNILMMTPWEGQMEKRENCMDQLINMRECLQDYIAGGIYMSYAPDGQRWRRWSYKRFALHKIRQKIRLNKKRKRKRKR